MVLSMTCARGEPVSPELTTKPQKMFGSDATRLSSSRGTDRCALSNAVSPGCICWRNECMPALPRHQGRDRSFAGNADCAEAVRWRSAFQSAALNMGASQSSGKGVVQVRPAVKCYLRICDLFFFDLLSCMTTLTLVVLPVVVSLLH